MNILLVNTLYAPYSEGGAEKSVQLLAESLATLGHRVAVATLDDVKETYREEINGVEVFRLPVTNIYWPFANKPRDMFRKAVWHALDTFNLSMAKALRKIVDSVRPDIVHTHNLSGFSVAVIRELKRMGLPVVHTLRDYYIICPRANLYRNENICEGRCRDCRVLSAPRIWNIRKVDVLVGISDFVLARHLAAGVVPSSGESCTIYNSVPTVEPLSPPSWETEGLILGFLGRIHEKKGIGMLTEAVCRDKTAQLYVGGQGDPTYVAELRSRAMGAPIYFLGHTKPSEFFKKVQFLVVPSLWHEPFGRVVIEAYAHGIPVIASFRGGLPELVTQGETGFMFDPEVPGDLERALEEARRNQYRYHEMRRACRAAAERFSLERLLDAHLPMYFRLVDKHANVPL